MNSLKEMQDELEKILPAECQLTKVEVEGPQVVIYLKNIAAFYANENLITRIASKVRKKVLLRCDSSVLAPVAKAKDIINSLVPEGAGIKELKFDPVFNEVIIEALKPGLVIGKGGMVLKSIILQTGWAPRVLRAPTAPSEVERAIRNALVHNSEDRKKFLVNVGKKMFNTPPSGVDWIKVTALGGFREVGRSCMLIQTPNSNVLLECGINPDVSDPSRTYPYLNAMGLSLEQLDAVIISHAHLDHCGMVPYLYAYGYNGPVYCTPPTRDLMVLLQQDCIHVLNSEGNGAPYGEKDIKKELNHIITRDYGEVTDVTPEIRFTFHNAGHVLGSAQVHLHIGEGMYNLVFSGDIKFGRTKLFEPADTRFPRVEALLMESTYGAKDDIKPRLEESEARLAEAIKRTIERRGKVLIPVLAVGRAQEVMLTLEELVAGLNVPIYMDGMSLEASAIHTVYPEYLRRNVQRRILQNDSPFEKPLFVSMQGKDRKAVAESEEPCIIVAPSGMLSGGPSVQFLKMLADDPKNLLVFVGFQSAMSLGRKIQNGEREVPILSENKKLETLKINMEVLTIDGFSGHSDRSQLLAYARAINPKPGKIFTLHGEESKTEELARTLNKMLRVETRAPMNLDSIRLR